MSFLRNYAIIGSFGIAALLVAYISAMRTVAAESKFIVNELWWVISNDHIIIQRILKFNIVVVVIVVTDVVHIGIHILQFDRGDVLLLG